MICGECQYCDMEYADYTWTVKRCKKHKDCSSWDDDVCELFTPAIISEEDSREKCLNCPKSECDDCIGYIGTSRGWTERDDKFLIEHQNESRPWLANALKRPLNAISKRRKQLGISDKRPRRFTAEEDAYLLTHTDYESEKHLKRPRCSIIARRRLLTQ